MTTSDNLVQFTISVSIPPDERGFIDRQCPSSACGYFFKVHDGDWASTCRAVDKAYCPQCNHTGPADDWLTNAQRDHLKRMARNQVDNHVHDMIARSMRGLTRGSSGGALGLKVSYRGPPKKPISLPTPVADALRIEKTCESCGLRHAVVGAAFFCPGCGRNQVESMFNGALEKVATKVTIAEQLRAGALRLVDGDADADFARSLLEGALADCVTAYQTFAEKRYVGRTGAPAPKNAFQRLQQGSDLWTAASGQGYQTWLTAGELARLLLLFQRRHVLAHLDGLVDAEYLSKSGDTTYVIGQRIVVAAADVRELLELIAKLAAAIRAL